MLSPPLVSLVWYLLDCLSLVYKYSGPSLRRLLIRHHSGAIPRDFFQVVLLTCLTRCLVQVHLREACFSHINPGKNHQGTSAAQLSHSSLKRIRICLSSARALLTPTLAVHHHQRTHITCITYIPYPLPNAHSAAQLPVVKWESAMPQTSIMDPVYDG